MTDSIRQDKENPYPTPPVIKAITGIRIDDHNSIALKTMTGIDGDTLYLSIESSGEIASFIFDNPYEARTFLQRALDAVDLYC